MFRNVWVVFTDLNSPKDRSKPVCGLQITSIPDQTKDKCISLPVVKWSMLLNRKQQYLINRYFQVLLQVTVHLTCNVLNSSDLVNL